jgi:Uma2 family endonuclease
MLYSEGATMATQIEKHILDCLQPGAMLVVPGVSWDEYERLLRQLSDRPGLRVTYDQGKLQIVSPGPAHEYFARFIDRIVIAFCDHFSLSVVPYGSATWKKQQIARGTEPDACYYVAMSELIIGRHEVDLERDPPPDIAVEIDATNESAAKFTIYASLGVREIWRYDVQHRRLRMYELSAGQYAEIAASRSLPLLSAAVLEDFIEQSKAHGQPAAMGGFKDWLRTIK